MRQPGLIGSVKRWCMRLMGRGPAEPEGEAERQRAAVLHDTEVARAKAEAEARQARREGAGRAGDAG